MIILSCLFSPIFSLEMVCTFIEDGKTPGTGTHRGDVGTSNVMFAQDVVHHGDGGIYVGRSDPRGGNHPFSVDDIHNQMKKTVIDKYDAAIAHKNAQLEANRIKQDIVLQTARKKAAELEILKSLDQQARVLEKENPEVLGKKAIPVVNFTQESNPLRHHVRMLNQRIEAIKDFEKKNIEAQRQLTKLDDISDKFRFNNSMVTNPKMYSRFLAAGAAQKYLLDIPVVDGNGSFYIVPRTGTGGGSHDGEYVEDTKNYMNDHTHFQNHGRYPIYHQGANGYQNASFWNFS